MLYWRKFIGRRPPRLRRRRYPLLVEGTTIVAPCAVAFLDVLGMRQLLGSRPLLKLASRVMEVFDSSTRVIPGFSFENSVLDADDLEELGWEQVSYFFSTFIADTLVVVLPVDPYEPSDKRAASEVLSVISLPLARLFQRNADDGVWLRGAISYGPCVLQVGQRFSVLGQPLIEASYWEKQQNWSGVLVTPSAVPFVKRSHLPHLFVPYNVPLKEDSDPHPSPLMALDWTGEHRGWIARLKKVKSDRSDVKLKIKETIEFCRRIDGLRAAI